MLNKFLIICSLTISSFAALQANNEEQKDLTPGAMVCNGSENRCTKEEGHKEETSSSPRFAVFCEDHQDEENLLACKDCQ